ncbi:aspartate carbamoyltransferase catalytic subunit [Terriglobus aquaticus]|uniref:Aspartate carbamoyltransferase n=1 Tax=Terriglobus aquaticus TaxID=940139 RepID=A0ABW9KNQ0_9BACT|nr:aspartate carbamoyltransferase catalytic subunit [Terriglobus aquaticus]
MIDGGREQVSGGGTQAGSLLSIADLSLEQVSAVLQQGDALAAEAHRERVARLDGRKVALLFYESSTRTRTSFELAAKSLGAMTTLVSDKSSSIEKGESLHDTGVTLRALGAECIILRSNFSGAPEVLARSTGLPVLNAGDGMHEHPSQALLDLRTMLEWFGTEPTGLSADTLRGKVVVITGDIRHSRVARSNARLLPRLGARVILCGPVELLPEEALSLAPGLEVERDFERALRQADVAMMLRVQRERLAGLELDVNSYVRDYQLHGRRLAEFGPGALVMHPGPMVRGLEITSDVADGAQSRIERQVTHGLQVRMALLCRALGCGESAGEVRA